MARFKGPSFPLSRSRYGQKARTAKFGKLATLRGKERAAVGKDAFAKALNVAKVKVPRG